MPRYLAPLLIVAVAILSGCTSPRKLRGGVPATSVSATRSALFVAPGDELLDRVRVLGPEQESTNGLILGFETPWEYVSPRTYRVPAGTVVFLLHAGPLTKRGSYSFGFQAKPGEIYDLRIEEIGKQRVTILERGTGRIASTKGVPKRYAR